MVRGIVRKGGGLIVPLAVALVAARGTGAHAEGPDATEKKERCASRVAASLLGRGATAELLAKNDPQAEVQNIVATPEFRERFARFLNARFNPKPGDSPLEDATYYMAKHVLEKNLPYREMFVGKLTVVQPSEGEPAVQANPDGLGYFRSPAWLRRYAGNEETGLKITTAYRIMNNTVGLTLLATTNAPEADVSATGRQAAGCRGCHYEGWFALDKAAAVLTRRRPGPEITFDPPKGGPQTVADKSVANDADLVRALVDSEAFEFNTCRIAFEYLYGRPESACESTVFDRCVSTFHAKKTIQSAIVAVAADPTFCQ